MANDRILFAEFNGQIMTSEDFSDFLDFKCGANVDDIKYFYEIKGKEGEDIHKVGIVFKGDNSETKPLIASCSFEEFRKLITYFTGVYIHSNT